MTPPSSHGSSGAYHHRIAWPFVIQISGLFLAAITIFVLAPHIQFLIGWRPLRSLSRGLVLGWDRLSVRLRDLQPPIAPWWHSQRKRGLFLRPLVGLSAHP